MSGEKRSNKAKTAPRKAADGRKAKSGAKSKANPKAKAKSKAKASSTAKTDALVVEAAWALADVALAEAISAAALLEAASDKAAGRLRRAKSAAQSNPDVADALEGETLAVRQALARAAKARGLLSFGEPGAIVAFDPLRHACVLGRSQAGAPARVVAPGVTAVAAKGERLLARALTRPAPRAKRKAPAKPRGRR